MTYKLIPFESLPFFLTSDVEVHIIKNNSNTYLKLNINYIGSIENIELFSSLLNGGENQITIKPRANELWKITCIEFFIKSTSEKKYWEFNISPLGFWNFYELDDYRSNLNESSLCEPVQFTFSVIKNQNLTFNLLININSLINYYPYIIQNGLLSITSVIRWKNNTTSYLALKHAENKPDFHSDIGFFISIPSLNIKGEL